MHCFKGFSLIEVLLSLMLTATVALFLLQLQDTSSLLLKQIVQYSKASSILNDADEQLLLVLKQRFKSMQPYSLQINENAEHIKVQVSWLSQYSLSRVYAAPYFFDDVI